MSRKPCIIVGIILGLFLSPGWASADFIAYNDVVWHTTQPPTANATRYDIGSGHPGSVSGLLKNFATGANTGVTAAFTQTGTVIWQSDLTSGGTDCAVGTDAWNVFNPTSSVSLAGVVYYGSSTWTVTLRFTGLNPNKAYTFVTSANRNGGSTYDVRQTKYTISDTSSFTNSSTPGVTISGTGGAISTFNTGNNTAAGYVARWINIRSGTDGDFQIVAAAASTSDPAYKAYAFSAFALVEMDPGEGACCKPDGTCEIISPSACTTASGTFKGAGTFCTADTCPQVSVATDNITDLTATGATLNGTLDDMGGQSQVDVYFEWGTDPDNLTETTMPEVATELGDFNAPLTGLTSGIEYYYRAVGESGTNTAYGDVLSFVYANNYGVKFNGTTSYVTMGAAPSLNATTFTLETWFKRLGTGTTASSGGSGITAIPLICKGMSEGNDGTNIDSNYFFGIRSSDNVIAADFEDYATGANHPVAGVTPITIGTWYHAAVTYDGTTWRLYLDGAIETELTVTATPRYDCITPFGLGVAQQSTGTRVGFFNGVLDEARVWNYARSQAEIQAAINEEVVSATGLIGRWGLNEGWGSTTADSSGAGNPGTVTNCLWAAGAPLNASLPPSAPTLVSPTDGGDSPAPTVPLTVHVSDPDSATLDVTFYGRELGSNPSASFTIVALPDTQNYSASYPSTFTTQTQWIVNNRTTNNIAYVAGVGDIVNDASVSSQWTNANNALSIFDNSAPTLPYGLCIGNHDENPNGDPNGTTAFNSNFPYTRYSSRSWYGGHYGTNNDCSYILFSAGGMDFIAIHLKYGFGSDAGILTWAGALLQNNPNRRAIVVEHDILNVGTPASWTSQGQTIYNALKVYPNLFLILCGHNHGEGSRSDVYNGNTVYSLIADYQDEPNGGNGYLRLMEFVPASNEIRIKTYSPLLGQYMTDADSQFTLSYNMGSVAFSSLGTVSAAPNDSDVSFPWTGLVTGKTFEWYATVSDGYRSVTGSTWSFNTVDPPPTGACCYTDGTPCAITTEANCVNDLPVTWHEGETCEEANCPLYYCRAECPDGDEWGEQIANVAWGSFSSTPNPSGYGTTRDGYSDFTGLTTSEMPTGASIPLTVTVDNYWNSDRVWVWVDWNQDIAFDNDDVNGNEMFTLTIVGDPSQYGGTRYFTGDIAVPSGATLGSTRLRVRMNAGDGYEPTSPPYSCGAVGYGEVEDYTVTVATGGACCYTDGTPCAITLEAACTGTWFANQTCEQAACPVFGACCYTDGTPCAITLEAACTGTWFANQTCEQAACPVFGACCYTDGTPCAITLEAACTGTWFANQTCEQAACPVYGACCYTDGTPCAITLEAACTGTWFANQTCEQAACPVYGACCYTDGTPCAITLEAACTGTWFANQTCEQAACPVFGACCYTDGTPCAITLEAACTGTWFANQTCEQAACPVYGACCYTDGTPCAITLEAACTGTWFANQTCEQAACPVYGACCYSDLTPCAITTEPACTGTWKAGQTCEQAACPVYGACCILESAVSRICVDGLTEAECLANFCAVYQGDGSTCNAVTCEIPVGACCLRDGTCNEQSLMDCTMAGGSWRGPCSQCETAGCPEAKACCFADGHCEMLISSACESADGVFHPEWADCDEADCQQPCALLGDVNGDGEVNGLDIAGFVRVKLDEPIAGDNAACADFGTGILTEEINAFIGRLISQ